MRHARRPTAVAVALVMTGTACRSGGAERPELVAHYASFEVLAGRPQRVLVGLAGPEGRVVAFGTVGSPSPTWAHANAPCPRPSSGARRPPASVPSRASAPIPPRGSHGWSHPRQATGVYGADGARFDRAGFWRVTVTAKIDGGDRRAEAAFEVLERPRLPPPVIQLRGCRTSCRGPRGPTPGH